MRSPAERFHDKKAKMVELFGTGTDRFIEAVPGMMGSIDIMAMDDWLHEKFGEYDANDDKSMCDLISEKFGEGASAWLEANMDPVM